MNKNILLGLGLLGVLGLGAYYIFSNQNQNNVLGGAGGEPGGRDSSVAAQPNYIFNLPAANFPTIDNGGGELTYDKFVNNTGNTMKKTTGLTKTQIRDPQGTYARYLTFGDPNFVGPMQQPSVTTKKQLAILSNIPVVTTRDRLAYLFARTNQQKIK